MSFQDRLKKMQKNAKEQMEDYTPNSFGSILDDTYDMRIIPALGETKKEPARLMITWKYIVASGDLEGRTHFDNTVIEDNKIGLHIARDRIEQLGYEWPEDITELESIINELTDKATLCVVQVVTSKKGVQYFNIKEVYASEETESTESTEEAEESTEEVQSEETQETQEEEETDANQSALLDFCAAQGIDGIDNGMSSAEIIEAFKENDFSFKSQELTEDEIKLFENLDAKELIKYPEPITNKAKSKTVISKKPVTKKKK